MLAVEFVLRDPTILNLSPLRDFKEVSFVKDSKELQKINDILNKLISDIKNEIDESEKLRTEAKVLLDNAQKKLDTAQSVSNEILEQAKKDSDRLIIELNDKFHKSSEIKKNSAQTKIIQMKDNAIKEIKNAKYSNTKSIEGLGVNISSVFQFKGLETDIVVLLIPNFQSLEATYTRNPLNLVYVGISRAEYLLYVVGSGEVKKLIN